MVCGCRWLSWAWGVPRRDRHAPSDPAVAPVRAERDRQAYAPPCSVPRARWVRSARASYRHVREHQTTIAGCETQREWKPVEARARSSKLPPRFLKLRMLARMRQKLQMAQRLVRSPAVSVLLARDLVMGSRLRVLEKRRLPRANR